MARKTPFFPASFAALIAALGLVTTGRTLAADQAVAPQFAGIQVTGNDATARFMALGVSKSVVIDLPTDIKDMFIADPGVVNAIVRTKRRVYIIGMALGQTNIYFFAADGRLIGALDIAVTSTTQSAALEDYPFPANVVLVYRAEKGQTLNCTPIRCIDATKPGSDQPPGTQNINVTGSSSTVAVTTK